MGGLVLEKNDNEKVEETAVETADAPAQIQNDAANRLSQEFTSDANPNGKSLNLSAFLKGENSQSNLAQGENEDFGTKDNSSSRKALSQALLSEIFAGARDVTPVAENTGENGQDLSIVDDSDAPNETSVTADSETQIKRRFFHQQLSRELRRAAKETSSHIAEVGTFNSKAAMQPHTDLMPPATYTGEAVAATNPGQVHILVVGKPQSFRDLEDTTRGGERPVSNLLNSAPIIEPYPASPPAIIINKPDFDKDKAPKPNEIAIGGSSQKPELDRLPTLKVPTELTTGKSPSEKTPTEKLPSGQVPSDSIPAGGLVFSPADKKPNKDNILLDSGIVPSGQVIGLPIVPDKIPDNFSTHISPLDINTLPVLGNPVGTLGAGQISRVDGVHSAAHAVFGVPAQTPIGDSRQAVGPTSSGAHRETTGATYKPEQQGAVALSRYSSQEWISSISSQKHPEDRQQTNPEGRQQTKPQDQKHQSAEPTRATDAAAPILERQKIEPVKTSEKTEAQAQIDSFRARNEQSIPSELSRSSRVVAYNALPAGSAERVFAGKSLAAAGESQLMRTATGAKNAELAMPQPFKLSSMDKALFVAPSTKIQNLESTVKGVQRDIASIASFSKIDVAAKRANAIAEQVTFHNPRSQDKTFPSRTNELGRAHSESKTSFDQQNKTVNHKALMSGQKSESTAVQQQPMRIGTRAAAEQSVRNEGQKRAEPTLRNDLQSGVQLKQDQVKFLVQNRIDTQTRTDARSDAKLNVSKFDLQVRISQKFIQNKSELIGTKLEHELSPGAHKIERGFALKGSFSATVTSEAMVTLNNARKAMSAPAGETCSKKDEHKRFFPGAELTLAAVLALSGARRRRRDENVSASAGRIDAESLAQQILHRRSYMVESGDTLQSIAERFYECREAAGLIADLNAASISEQSMDGKRIVELRARQSLELPEAEEVGLYLSALPKNYDVEKIVTIVKDNAVDVELLRNFLGQVCDDKVSAATTVTAPTNMALPAKPELPTLSIEDRNLPPPAAGLGAVVTDLASLISRGLKRPTQDLGALS